MAGVGDPKRRVRLAGLDERSVRKTAARIAGMVEGRCTIHLAGPIGAGKTVFAARFLGAFGVEASRPSPSYALFESYAAGDRRLGHMDFFRLTDPGDWVAAGLAEQSDELDVCLIEWPSNAEGLPEPDLLVEIGIGNEPELRDLVITGYGPWGSECCGRLSSH